MLARSSPLKWCCKVYQTTSWIYLCLSFFLALSWFHSISSQYAASRLSRSVCVACRYVVARAGVVVIVARWVCWWQWGLLVSFRFSPLLFVHIGTEFNRFSVNVFIFGVSECYTLPTSCDFCSPDVFLLSYRLINASLLQFYSSSVVNVCVYWKLKYMIHHAFSNFFFF